MVGCRYMRHKRVYKHQTRSVFRQSSNHTSLRSCARFHNVSDSLCVLYIRDVTRPQPHEAEAEAEATTHEAEAEATTHEAEAEAEATTHEAEAEAEAKTHL